MCQMLREGWGSVRAGVGPVGRSLWGGAQCVGAGTHLPENQLPVHVHGQVPEVQEHLVRGQLLLNDVIPIDGHDGHADEKVEVIRLGVQRGGSGKACPPAPALPPGGGRVQRCRGGCQA